LLFLCPFVAPMMDHIHYFKNLSQSVVCKFFLFSFVSTHVWFLLSFSFFVSQMWSNLFEICLEVSQLGVVVAIIHKLGHKWFLPSIFIAIMMMMKMKKESCNDGFVFNCNDGKFVYLEIHFDFSFCRIIKLLNESCKCVYLFLQILSLNIVV
jgi:hypothetical protein